ncbi:beta-galactosidase [Streptomyces sp. NPDC006460]|uniref:beta-galactosidase n=1 Tax=Streptomyces sp. NPDC006460 TaxID=3154304 RepID=UPI0033AF8CF0
MTRRTDDRFVRHRDALKTVTDRLGGIAYGGDYNPEQWPREVWTEDARLMREAGVNLVTVGVFSWSRLEPRPGDYDFAWLDDVLDLLHAHGVAVDLATPTAAPPPWFSHAHPESLPVTRTGTRQVPGSRQVFCPSNPDYAHAADAIVRRLAPRYADHPAVVLWHVHNEWGNHNALCYCDVSAAAFRLWLRERYETLDELNTAWGTDFWSQRYGDWQEIQPPRDTPAFINPTQDLDYRRFSSDALLRRHRAESALIREHSPRTPLTTNLMGTLEKKIDGFAFAEQCDVVSVDHYLTAADRHAHVGLALNADLARGMAAGAPWMLMEHSTSAVNWQPVNVAKRPGEMRRNSLAHIARGADAVMFFQWRQAKAGAEKWHSAMLPHNGTQSSTWREVTRLGRHLRALTDVRGSTVDAHVALVFDWHAWWALELDARPSAHLRYLDLVHSWYEALWSLGHTCDIVPPGSDLSAYRAVLVPSLYLVTDDDAANLHAYARGGGHLLIGAFSGVVDVNDHVRPGPQPGALRDLLGLHVDEYLPVRATDRIALSDGSTAHTWAERLVLHDATATLRFAAGAPGGPAPGEPAVTVNRVAAGSAEYIATHPEPAVLRRTVAALCRKAGVLPTADVPVGVEAVRRRANGGSFLFLINHLDESVTVPVRGTDLVSGRSYEGKCRLGGGDVVVVREYD